MSEFKRILIPLDGSTDAEVALAAAMPIARQAHSEFHLVRVVEEAEPPETAQIYLQRVAGALRRTGVATTVEVRAGRAAEEILSCAPLAPADLIAMTTHGRSGLSRLFLGSVTEEVLRRADVPLLVCRPGQVTPEWRRIVLAVDGSSRAEQILPDAVRLARNLGASVDALAVVSPIVTGPGLGDAPFYLEPSRPLPYLRKLCDRLGTEGVAAQVFSPIGGAAEEIVAHARDTRAGLICMTTHGRTGFLRLLVGSVAEYVLRHAPCPVLVRRVTAVPSEVSHA